MPHPLRLAAAFPILVLGACSIARIPHSPGRAERKEPVQALTLTIDPPPDSIHDGSSNSVRYRLRNVGDTPIDACVSSEEPGIDLVREGGGSGRNMGFFSGRCARRFALAPGETLSGSVTLHFPRVGPGPAQLRMRLPLLDPASCNEAGCKAWVVASSFRPVLVTR